MNLGLCTNESSVVVTSDQCGSDCTVPKKFKASSVIEIKKKDATFVKSNEIKRQEVTYLTQKVTVAVQFDGEKVVQLANSDIDAITNVNQKIISEIDGCLPLSPASMDSSLN